MKAEIKQVIIDFFAGGALDVAELGRYLTKDERELYCSHDCLDRVCDMLRDEHNYTWEQVGAFIDANRVELVQIAKDYSGVTFWRCEDDV